ncbi:hypothetical protein CAPTEDRAFT_187572 [Capitella teleta]|uniref:Uncharacterized protein n=1 Tax=Capitella teleta TaxID=283909 RepID=R7UDD3_CAPTE|nr:hypothetical protein CAPTEDRAFT_187572 [Capitella teleta]|eukprot:ELU04116.1 hypothetical protein CAPTEDRAFT_187572 [Capitella teleta]
MCEVGKDWIRDMTKKKMNERVMEVGKEEWKRLLQSTELTRKYAVEKEAVKLESCADGSVGASLRMLLRGDCLPVRTNSCVHWRYREEERDRVCGERETEEHVLLDCVRYEFWHKRQINGEIVLL